MSSEELSAYIFANGGQHAAMMSKFMQQYSVTGEDFVFLSTDSLDSSVVCNFFFVSEIFKYFPKSG